MRTAIVLLSLAVALPSAADADPLAHTYSIVARDPATGEMGVAVQSHWFSVGSIVTWAEAGVGAVATQSFVDPGYGERALSLLRRGVPPAVAMAQLVAADAQRDVRQVAIVDNTGRVAVHTGRKAIADAGHLTGAGYSVQANLMANARVWPEMARAYERTSGDLADRLLAALDAAEAAGGDIRGRQSSALRVVRTEPAGDEADLLHDARVDDRRDPNVELRRIVRLRTAHLRLDRADDLRAGGRVDDAVREARAALELAPESVQLGFWWGLELAKLGRDEEARPLLHRAFAADPGWRELVPRLVTAGLLEADAATVARIVAN
jgi:uncharacterized Ntn-hydrolase superfamily protein